MSKAKQTIKKITLKKDLKTLSEVINDANDFFAKVLASNLQEGLKQE